MSKTKRRLLIVVWSFVLIILLIIGMFLLFDANIRPVVIALVSARTQAMAARYINDAANETLYSGLEFDDLVRISTGELGRVSYVQADAVAINRIGVSVAQRAQSRMEEELVRYVDIPLGSFVGGQLLSGRGPNVRISTLPVGISYTRYKSEFIAAGINQTRHRIFLEIVTQVRVVIPPSSEMVTANNEILVAETIIIGDVPQSYISVEDLEDSQNFVPDWN